MPFHFQQTKIEVYHMMLLAAAPRSSAVRLQISDSSEIDPQRKISEHDSTSTTSS
jgi:hypothetical protein